MDIQEFARALNGREYGRELTKGEERKAKENGIAIVFGASDDLMEFRGAIDGEVDCYNGGTALLDADGLFYPDCDNDECKLLQRHIKSCKAINAVWGKGGYSWSYETEIRHATFDILDSAEKYCKGIVFLFKDAS